MPIKKQSKRAIAQAILAKGRSPEPAVVPPTRQGHPRMQEYQRYLMEDNARPLVFDAWLAMRSSIEQVVERRKNGRHDEGPMVSAVKVEDKKDTAPSVRSFAVGDTFVLVHKDGSRRQYNFRVEESDVVVVMFIGRRLSDCTEVEVDFKEARQLWDRLKTQGYERW